MCFILRNQIELHTVQLEVETSTFLRTSCSKRDKTNTLASAPIQVGQSIRPVLDSTGGFLTIFTKLYCFICFVHNVI